MKSNRTLAVIFTLTTALLLPRHRLHRRAQEKKPFEPTVGQAGKDVIWVPMAIPSSPRCSN